jgi:hypothetical protein
VFCNPDGVALQASKVQVGHVVFLHDGFRAVGEVQLIGATITRDLECRGGRFCKPGGEALQASEVTVGGNVTLSTPFHADGKVSLTGARITGMLACQGGRFDNPGGEALEASRVTVGGDVTLNAIFHADGTMGAHFHADGKVSLTGARITGLLSCQGGRFDNPGGEALQAAAITVGGAILLSHGFRAEGVIDLNGSNVGSHLDFYGAQFIGETKNGLLAENLTAKGLFDWRKVAKTDSTILDLWGARVGQLADDKCSWPKCQNLDVDDFIYAAIADGPVDATIRVDWLKRQASLPLNLELSKQAPRPRPFRPKPYQQLAKVLRESGHEVAAKRILIAKEQARRKHGELGSGAWAWSMLLGATIGHGYRPWQALLWAAFWIMLGGILFGMGYHKEIVIPAKAEAYDTTKKTLQETAFYPAFNRWLYSLDAFVPIINFGQKDYWGPQVSCHRSGPIRDSGIRFCVFGIRVLHLYRWLHIGVGWMLITLVVAGFTGLVRKE